MASRDLAGIRRSLEEINSAATKTKMLFQDLQQSLSYMKAGGLIGTVESLKAANIQLNRFITNLRKAAAERRVPGLRTSTVGGLTEMGDQMGARGAEPAQIARSMQKVVQLRAQAFKAMESGDVEAWNRSKEALNAYLLKLNELISKKQQVSVTDPTGGVGPKKAPAGGEITDQTRQQDLFRKSIGMSGRAGETAEKFLDKYGMTLGNVKTAAIDAGSGTRLFTFETGKGTGVLKRATIAFDKYGNLVRDTSTRFRSFTDMISRNVIKVIQWALAVGVVYGALTKLREGAETLKDIDEAMSNIALSTGDAMGAVTGFFEASSEAARDTGMNLEGVLNIYDDALRATRAIPETGLRLEISDTLVRDALTFSRLAGVDTKTAMDTLVGALKQVRVEGESLSDTLLRSGDILDLWVYTSQRANVSIKDLAETFAVTGAAAQSAGVDIHTLTALSAVLAESTSKSAAEVGNTIRRLLGQTQSETGNAALKRYGIALKDVTDEARAWDDIMTEIAVKFRAGVLSDAAIQDLAYAIGGGPRGSADFIAAIKAWDEVLSKAAVSKEGAAGKAQEALALKAGTLTTKLNELSTAWTTLVQKMGYEGGALEGLISMAAVLTSIVDSVGDLASVLGPATIRMVAFAATFAVLSRYSPMISRAIGQSAVVGQLAGDMPAKGAGGSIGGALGTGWNRIQANKSGLAMSALYAGMSIGGEEGSKDKILKGGMIMGGALISTALGGSPIVGAAIGDAASSAIIKAFDKAELFKLDPGDLDTEKLKKQYEEAAADITRRGISPLVSMGIEWTKPGLLAGVGETAMAIYKEQGRDAAVAYVEAFYAEIRETLPKGLAGLVFTYQPMERMIEALDIAGAAQTEATERGVDIGDGAQKESLLQKMITQEQKDMAKYKDQVLAMTDTFTALRQTALGDWMEGKISKKSYKDYLEGIEDAELRAGILFESLVEVSDMALEKVATNFAAMPIEVRDELLAIVTLINQLEEAIYEAKLDKDIELELMLTDRKEDHFNQLQAFWDKGLDVPLNIKPFEFIGFTDWSEYTEEQIAQIWAAATEMQAIYAETFEIIGYQWDEMTEDMVLRFEDGTYEMRDTLNSVFINQAKRDFDDLNKKADDFAVKRLKDIEPGEEYKDLTQRVEVWHKFLMQIPGYEQVEKEPINLIIGEDPQFRRLISTQEALRFALEELAAIEKKRLEGQWNIPEGATVMVPLTSLYYAPDKEAGGPGGAFEGADVVFDAAETSSTSLATALDTTTLATMTFEEALREFFTSGMQYGLGAEEPRVPSSWEEEKYGLAPGQEEPIPQQRRYPPGAYEEEPSTPEYFRGKIWDTAQPEIEAATGNVVNALEGISLDSTLTSAVDVMTTVKDAVFGVGDSINLLFNELIGKPEPAPAPIVINTTIELDGRVVARSINRIQSEQLSQASSQEGYTSGGIIT